MRLYLHYQDQAIVWHVDNNSGARVEQAVQGFIDARSQQTNIGTLGTVQARLANGHLLHHSKRLVNAVADRDSIFMTFTGVVAKGATAFMSRPTAEEGPAAQRHSKAPLTMVTVSSSVHPRAKAAPLPLDDCAKSLLASADAEAGRGNVAGALAVCCAVLDRMSTNQSALRAALHLCLDGRISGTVIPPTNSSDYVPWRLQRGLQLAQEHADSLRCDWRGAELLGDVCMANAKYAAALQHYAAAAAAAAQELLDDGASNASRLLLRIKTAAAKQQTDATAGAAELKALCDAHREQAVTNATTAWLCYYIAADNLADLQSVCDHVLASLGHSPVVDRAAAALAASAVGACQDGVKALVASYTRREHGPQCMATLGQLLVQAGSVEHAIPLLRRAARLRPLESQHTLHLLAALQAVQDIDGGLAAVQEWLQQATTDSAAPWTTAPLLRLLRDVRAHRPAPLLGYYAHPGWGRVEHAGSLPSVGGVHHWAVVFSLVRMLFVAGHLAAVQSLVDMGAAVSTPLPNPGPYRNEAAYFTCIRKIMQRAPPPAAQPTLPLLFLLGDSHILPGSWRQVVIGGAKHLTVPVLVPGCKAFDLRRGSTQHTARHVQRLLAALPAGSTVVVVFGELDCREGLLQAVRQAKHASLRTAVDHLASVYVQALVDMAGTNALRVLVHPIPPVQDACRLVVRHLNNTLQARVARHGSITWLDCETAMLEPKPAALEVDTLDKVFGGAEDDPAKLLLGGAKFRQALSFDGAHMQPALYTEDVLGAALRAL